MLRLRGLVKNYGKVKALKGIDIYVKSGDIVGFLGPNGSGKTTTINIITGICRPDEGTVEILGINALHQYEKVGHHIAVVYENNGLYPMLTAEENLEYFARLRDLPVDLYRKSVEDALKVVGLLERKNDLTKTFSKGMLRRLAIARAMIFKPKILILDEPFDGIDISSRKSLIKLFKTWIRQQEHCIIMTSHSMADFEALCNKIIILKSGEILASEDILTLQKEQSSLEEIYLNRLEGKYES